MLAQFSAQPDPHRTPTPRFVRWDSGLPIRCDLLVRSLLPAGAFSHDPPPCSILWIESEVCIGVSPPLSFQIAYPRGVYKFQDQGCKRSQTLIIGNGGDLRGCRRLRCHSASTTVRPSAVPIQRCGASGSKSSTVRIAGWRSFHAGI